MKRGLLKLTQRPAGASLALIATNRLARLLSSNLAELVQENGNIGLPSWRIYTGLAKMEEASQKELVAHTQIEQSHISRALAQLEDRGELVSRRCTLDKRARRFSFTPVGRANFERLLPIVETYSNTIDQALSAQEMESYISMTRRLAHAAVESAEAADKQAEVDSHQA